MQRFNQINHVIDHTLPHVSRRRGMVGGACPLTGLGGGSSGTPGVKAPTDANKNNRDWWPNQLDLRPLH